jgi:hypothetical protein
LKIRKVLEQYVQISDLTTLWFNQIHRKTNVNFVDITSSQVGLQTKRKDYQDVV